MTSIVLTSFTITRLIDVPVAYDAAGQAICEAQDIDIDGTVTAIRHFAEPDVGIPFDWFDDLMFTTRDAMGFTVDYELSDQECERVQERLKQGL